MFKRLMAIRRATKAQGRGELWGSILHARELGMDVQKDVRWAEYMLGLAPI